jgi:hypothetical protein
MAKVDWDQNQYETSKGFDPIPKGRYLLLVTDSDDKKTRDKKGRYFEFEFAVLAPKEFKGRKLWARFNVHNASEVAQRIGREQFNSLAQCCDMLGKVQKTEQLHDKVVVGLVAIVEGTKGDMNEITGFQKPEGAKGTAAPAAQPAAKPAPEPAPAEIKQKAAFDADDDDIPF